MLDKYIEIIKNHHPNTKGVRREASVLIPLIERDHAWHLLYEKRALTLITQPGEVCFPGGAIEDFEHSCAAAVRETCEELNLSISDLELVGQLDSIMTSFDMIIHCYIGIIKVPFEDIHYATDEVDSIFTVPIQHFLDHPPEKHLLKSTYNLSDDFPFDSIPNGKDYNFKAAHYPVLFYVYNDMTIWGLTARMTEQFINLIQQDI